MGACCVGGAGGNCFVLTPADCALNDGVYAGDGTTCATNPCPGVPTGACCVGGAGGICSVITQTACEGSSGVYAGDGTDCNSNPCPPAPTGACCVGGTNCITNLTATECLGQGGVYQGDGTTVCQNCTSDTIGSCCLLPGGTGVNCSITTQAECTGVWTAGGSCTGLFTQCDDNVDFANVLVGTYDAGTQYDALAGNDTVHLPTTTQAADQSGFVPGHLFSGGEGNDSIYTGGLDDNIDAGPGDDTIYGSDGDDTIDGGTGINTINYSLLPVHVDVFLDSHVATKYFGDIGELTRHDDLQNIQRVVGSNLGDQIIGDDQVNVLDGGGGDDFLRGKGQADTLLGGADNDILFGEAGDDTLDGGPGIDTAVYIGLWYEYNYTSDPGGLRITDRVSSRDGSDVITNIEMLFISGSQYNLFVGTTGTDTLTGTSVADILLGLDGADTLSGSDGNDVLIGGPGDDTMTGGAGNDSFAFYMTGQAGEGDDMIVDFSTTSDTLHFIGVADIATLDSFSTFSVVNGGADLLVTFTGGGSITLDGLGASGFTHFSEFPAGRVATHP